MLGKLQTKYSKRPVKGSKIRGPHNPGPEPF